MINIALYKKEIKGSIKLLIIFSAIITMYVSIIISMFDPELMKTLDSFAEVMPQLMAAVGMTGSSATLLGFMITYLYGFIFLVFPMVYCILRGNGLVAKYTDNGSMVNLLASPVKRSTIVCTQIFSLISGLVILILYSTILELVVSQVMFPGELDITNLLKVNAGLLCLHFFIAGVCFLASCLASDTKLSLSFGAGIPALMYVLQMLANTGDKAEKVKYFTFFTLYDATGLVGNSTSAVVGMLTLMAGAVVLFFVSAAVYCKRDFHI